MKTLLTGATGFLGSAVLRQLVEDGQNVPLWSSGSRGQQEGSRSHNPRDYLPEPIRRHDGLARALPIDLYQDDSANAEPLPQDVAELGSQDGTTEPLQS